VESRWFSPGTSVSFINKTDRHNITDISLKVALNTITLTITVQTIDLARKKVTMGWAYDFVLQRVTNDHYQNPVTHLLAAASCNSRARSMAFSIHKKHIYVSF
jgi:hypothetical protein